MKKQNCIKKLTLLFVFVLSFVFQTAYSLSFKAPDPASFDYLHKHIEKAPAKEEVSDSYMEKETENDNELDFELFSFIVPQFFYQTSVESHSLPLINTLSASSSDKESIFVIIHNFRI